MSRVTGFLGFAAAAALTFGAPVSTQADETMQVGKATVSVGTGTAILTLPDVPSLVTNFGLNPFPLINGFKFSDDFGDEIGWNVNGSIEAPLGADKTISLSGFWANIDDKDTASCVDASVANICTVAPLVDNPAINQTVATITGETLFTTASRDVDNWGVSVEVKRQLPPKVMGVTRAPSRRYFALGADVRGIDQELDVNFTYINAPAGFGPMTYSEDLDTRYYGAYAAWGGDLRPFLFKGLWERWGLQSAFQLRGGLYYADTDYSGVLTDQGVLGVTPASALTLSDNEVSFIGGLTLETTKRIGHRAALSLKSEYEYYSYFPEMAYNQVDTFGAITAANGGRVGTRIGSDDAFSARTMLRLKIGLGHREMYQEPLK